jgi:hypothetical protein
MMVVSATISNQGVAKLAYNIFENFLDCEYVIITSNNA